MSTPLKRKRSKPRRGVLKDPAYLAWIREQPCFLCCYLAWRAQQFINAFKPMIDGACVTVHLATQANQQSPTEAAHVGARGLGQKCSDRETLPLCGIEHHRIGPYSHHKLGKRFAEFHNIDIPVLIAQYQESYERWRNG